ncbi:MAG TPA: CoB--CoM heterodisulfide reductase iron-sulfur subunit B family protein [Thermoguttaceae bacterium]|nr:CoB--CoM heterodisulfide reductase iron-sulfur subunit B family protein [Thermoguttaceae bacterium]
MEATYYPGCSLHAMATEYDRSIRAVCETLGVDLVELPDWSCCGASSAHFFDDELAIRLPARNMVIAEQAGREVLVPCSACFQRLKHADKELKKDAARWTDQPYEGKAAVYHVNEFLARPELVDAIRRNVTRPLAGLTGVAYYGCLSQRPPKVTDAAEPENPTSMDRLLETIGMEVRPWSYKTDCCGASLTLTRTDVVHKLSGDLFEAAQEAGAECLVTDCPMCQSNLDTRQGDIEAERGKRFGLPVFYLTELIGLAFGYDRTSRWWKKHFVDPVPLLSGKGLL